MSDRFYFRSTTIGNYRALKQVDIPKLRRINIIGGLNGAGKTTLLEALFLLLNIGDPARILRPFVSRGIRADIDVINSLLFTSGDASATISIRSETRDGVLEAKLSSEAQLVASNINAGISGTVGNEQVSRTSLSGITVRTFVRGRESDVSHFFDMQNPGAPPGIAMNKTKAQQVQLPTAALIDKSTQLNLNEVASRYSTVVQSGFKQDVVDLAQTVLPECTDVTLLQIGGVPQVCGQTQDGQFLPLSFLGEGANIAINIGLALLSLRNGVLMLDEFDTALHHSKLKPVWLALAKLCRQVNCQIIAVTHSLECIRIASDALFGTDMREDFQFVRLDKVGGKIKVTSYDTSELHEAFLESWEVR
jgi:energy-coupling factor transporter ATP-binding protein EcfA2